MIDGFRRAVGKSILSDVAFGLDTEQAAFSLSKPQENARAARNCPAQLTPTNWVSAVDINRKDSFLIMKSRCAAADV